MCRQVGRSVEVHHIVPAANGGPTTLDNAIVLCFNCHAEAGHYNPRHPRGTKYSPAELRRHRDEWWVLTSTVDHLREIPGVHQQTSYKEHSDAARVITSFLQRLNRVHLADTLWDGVRTVPGSLAAEMRQLLQEFGGLPPGHPFNAGVPEFVQLQREVLTHLQTMSHLLGDLQSWSFDLSTSSYEPRMHGLLSSDREQAKRVSQTMAMAWRTYSAAVAQLRALARRDP